MKLLARVSLVAALLLLALFPLVFGQLMVAGLAKLHLSQAAALTLVMAIIFGGLVNIPIKRLPHPEEANVHPLSVFGLSDLWPTMRRTHRETIIAVNVGGCLVPAGLAVYELIHLAAAGPRVIAGAGVAVSINVTVCYVLARPVPQVGIGIPGLIPPLIAAILALVLAPQQAAPVAFIAGVSGPLVGADLLHLHDIQRIGAGVASIGGAGTFDGIVLSGIVAAYLS